jgi:hypothetical protein
MNAEGDENGIPNEPSITKTTIGTSMPTYFSQIIFR